MEDHHSPFPWRLTRESGGYSPTIVDAKNEPVVLESGLVTVANAKRIVAAVNFCHLKSRLFLESHRLLTLDRDGLVLAGALVPLVAIHGEGLYAEEFK